MVCTAGTQKSLARKAAVDLLQSCSINHPDSRIAHETAMRFLLAALIFCPLPQSAVPEDLRREQRWQAGPYCGPNCLYFLLRALEVDVSHSELLDQFGDLEERGTSLAEMQEVAAQYDVRLETFRATEAGLSRIQPPFVAHLSVARGKGHFVLVSSVGRERIRVLDGTRLIVQEFAPGTFVRMWSGYVLVPKGGRRFGRWALVIGSMMVASTFGFALVLGFRARHAQGAPWRGGWWTMQTRKGFTLLEILVVIFIIGILAALLLPAIHRARAKARSTSCLSKLSNVGKALLLHEQGHRAFPASGYFGWDPGLPAVKMTGPLRSWVVEVLPELDQQPIHDRWDFDSTYLRGSNKETSQVHLAAVVCPDDDTVVPDGPSLSYVLNGGFAKINPANPASAIVWVHNPAGVGASQYDALPVDFNGNDKTGAWDAAGTIGMTDLALLRQTGLFFPAYVYPNRSLQGGSIDLASVRDGQSQTILASENLSARVHPFPAAASWAQADETTFQVSGYVCERIGAGPAKRASCGTGRVHYSRANLRIMPYEEQAINGSGLPTVGQIVPENPWLASNHPGGVNIVMCDGSGRFLSENVSGDVFARLVTPAGSYLPGDLRQSPLDDSSF